MLELRKARNLVFVVCHPDDEALWVGGLLRGLSLFERVNVHVVCLSGAGQQSTRESEFLSAQSVAGYRCGVVMGGALRAATDPLPPTGATLEAGLARLGLSTADVDLLVTHSPYGDEHMHPHHVQSCEELYSWAAEMSVSFGYFTCVPLPNGSLVPVLRNMKRKHGLQLLNFSWCKYGILRKAIRRLERKPWRYPLAYMQWQVDMASKQKMLACYESIGLAEHANGYAMFSSNVESLYLFDKSGVELISQLVSAMEVPGAQDFFLGSWTDGDIRQRIVRKLSFGRL